MLPASTNVILLGKTKNVITAATIMKRIAAIHDLPLADPGCGETGDGEPTLLLLVLFATSGCAATVLFSLAGLAKLDCSSVAESVTVTSSRPPSPFSGAVVPVKKGSLKTVASSNEMKIK